MLRLLKSLVIAAVLLGSAAILAVSWTLRYVERPLPLDKPLIFTVAPGSSLNTVAQELAAKGALPHPSLWVWYARWQKLATRIHAGEYEVRPGITPRGVLDRLVRGEVILHSVTLVEGSTFRELLRVLAAQPPIKQTLAGMSERQIMAQLGAPDAHPEGQFFPDTYRFAAGTSDLDILKQAYAELQRRLAAAWKERSADLPLETPYQALVLASLIEKETALPTERARIGGVFVRRLRLGMRLQSDPTVIYGLGATYDGDIRRRDLRGDTPYNTYTRDGLPPTPIALPGEASLKAATQPDDTGAIFFVATGEPDGSHYFSKTLEEHSAAVRRYLERTRSQHGSGMQ